MLATQDGVELAKAELLPQAKRLGFGAGCTLAEGVTAAAGTLPTLSQTDAGELANLSFGQGRLTATPVQVAAMTSTASELLTMAVLASAGVV